jgi:hypothetical protein
MISALSGEAASPSQGNINNFISHKTNITLMGAPEILEFAIKHIFGFYKISVSCWSRIILK